MAERVHPTTSETLPPAFDDDDPETPLSRASFSSNSNTTKPKVQPDTYVIQVPKDQIYRLPPPENAHRARVYARRATSRPRRSCVHCLFYTLLSFAAALLLVGALAGILYLSIRPKLPIFSATNFAAAGLDPSASTTPLSPNTTVVLRAYNPNKNLVVQYTGGDVKLSYGGAKDIAGTQWPAFRHGKREVQSVSLNARGSGVKLSEVVQRQIAAEQRRGTVALQLHLRASAKYEVWKMRSWLVWIKVSCEISVDKLDQNSKIASQSCKTKFQLW